MVTAFRAGHAVTLSLAAAARAALPAARVEVLVAVTTPALAVELAREEGPLPSPLERRPALLAFAFGLLHGFAGALRAAGILVGVVFRSHGGDNRPVNRISVCTAHHLPGLHTGRERAQGPAPHGIVRELGCRNGEDLPLLKLIGDRYLAGN